MKRVRSSDQQASAVAIKEVPGDTPIWRYMDLSRFVAVVFTGRLWFPKLKVLWSNDPWEGFGRAKGLSRPSRSKQPKNWPANEVGQLIYAESSGYAAETVRNAHEYVYANSWCMGADRLGMWERYGDGARGVAIESTVSMFKASLTRELRPGQYAFGAVTYERDLGRSSRIRSDFSRGTVPLSNLLWQRTLSIAFNKRVFYDDENEWRAAIFQEQKRNDINGLDIPIELNSLIKSVRVGPRADQPTVESIKAVLKAVGLDSFLRVSDILERPKIRRSR